MSLASRQGHNGAAAHVGTIYFGGRGVAVDQSRAMAAYKVAAEGGDAGCQGMVGTMYCNGLGVDVDYKLQALAWLEKAAAQDGPAAVRRLGWVYFKGKGVTPSWRRAREYYERTIELGYSRAAEDMRDLTTSIQNVTSQRSNHFTLPSVLRDLALLSPHSLLPSHSQFGPLMDKRVEIHGTTRADMNGKRGIATDFHSIGETGGAHTTWRYTVKLDGGEAFKFKLANVRAEGARGGGNGGGGGAGAGKAKGKGKKGRGDRK